MRNADSADNIMRKKIADVFIALRDCVSVRLGVCMCVGVAAVCLFVGLLLTVLRSEVGQYILSAYFNIHLGLSSYR